MTIILSNKDKAIKYILENEDIVRRFQKHLLELEDGCIEFTGARTDKGYGTFAVRITKDTASICVKAHRLSYAIKYGFDKLPVGTDKTQKRKVLHHKCENKACVNPLHLEVVSDRWNLGRVNDKNMF